MVALSGVAAAVLFPGCFYIPKAWGTESGGVDARVCATVDPALELRKALGKSGLGRV